jgi:hypothetical protein
VRVHTNALYSLVSIVSLGLYVPQTAEWWCERLGEWVGSYGVQRVYYDSAQPAFKDAFRQACGVRTPEVDKSIEDGVAAVANMMLPYTYEGETEQRSRLYVHPRCQNLIRELSMYRRRSDPKDPDRYTDDIVDKDNHGPDALRYLIAGHFGLKKTLHRP